jgi:hypothetical protein
VAVTLPWREPGGRPETARLLDTTRERTALARIYCNRHVWKPVLEAAGVPTTRDNGMHAARQYHASALLEDGVSLHAVAEYLGHNDWASPCASTPTSCRPAKDGSVQLSTASWAVARM